MRLGPIRRVKLYEQVVSIFRDRFETGDLKPGDRVPPERELVDQLGVSRAVLREALRVMEVKGILENVPGEGRVFVNNDFMHLERINDQLRQSAVLEVLDARMGVECRTVELAAERATAKEIKAIRSFIRPRGPSIIEPRDNFDANGNFHLAIAAAAKNAVLHALLRMLLILRGDVHRIDLLNAAAYEKSFRDHEGIAKAIEKGSANEARELMRLHIESTKAIVRDAK
jgi:GntR family transcriptional repressor for pyruvate dehydrogenase complex